MALTGQDIEIRLTVDGALNDAQPDPQASIGGARSSTTIENTESALTAAQTDARRLVDTDIGGPPAAGSPDSNTPLTNFGSYNNAADLVHWFRPGYQNIPTNPEFGVNFGSDTTHDLSQADSNIDVTEFADVQPGQFNGARQSYLFGESVEHMSSTAANAGIGANWTVLVHLRPESVAAGNDCAFELGLLTNRIYVGRNGAEPQIIISDDTTSADRKDYRVQDGGLQLSAGASATVGAIWNGTTLDIYVDGTLAVSVNEFEDDTLTMTDSSRVARMGSSNIFAGREWDGYVHSVLIWNTNLTAASFQEVEAFGDGPVVEAVQAGDWIAFVTGTNALEANVVSAFDDATGSITFDNEWSALAASGDVYRLFRPNNLYDPISAGESVGGNVDYRAVAIFNDTGSTFTDFRGYIIELDPGPTRLELAIGDRVTQIMDVEPNGDTAPDLTTTNSGYTNVLEQVFESAQDYAASTTPRDLGANLDMGTNAHHFIWLRRTIEDISRTKDRCAFLVVVEGTNAGGDPDPLATCFVVTFGVTGFAANVAVNPVTNAYIGGGTTVLVQVTDTTTGIDLPGVPVNFVLVTPLLGSLIQPAAALETDVFGEARITFLSSTDEADAGSTVTVRAEVD